MAASSWKRTKITAQNLFFWATSDIVGYPVLTSITSISNAATLLITLIINNSNPILIIGCMPPLKYFVLLPHNVGTRETRHT